MRRSAKFSHCILTLKNIHFVYTLNNYVHIEKLCCVFDISHSSMVQI